MELERVYVLIIMPMLDRHDATIFISRPQEQTP